VTIKCDACGVPMRFIGLPTGVDLHGAAVSLDGTEGRFAIAPKGEVVSELEGTAVGFTVRKRGQDENSEIVSRIIEIAAALARFQHRYPDELDEDDMGEIGVYSARLKKIADAMRLTA